MLISNLPEPYKTLAEFFRSESHITQRHVSYPHLISFDWQVCTGTTQPHHGKFWRDLNEGGIPNSIPIGILSYYENKSGKRLDYVPGSGAARVSTEPLPNLDGFVVDEEASTEDKIVLVKKPAVLPKSWEDLGHISGFWTESASGIRAGNGFYSSGSNKNLFDTKEQADASIALAQLSQLRKVYRQGWEPDWNDKVLKWVIYPCDNKLYTGDFRSGNHFLSFKSLDVAVLFLENFEDLIKKALPLMS
jgi:hypothetical protein